MSSDIDFQELAELANGYSGDDISGVCRDAAMASMRRKIAGKTPAEIKCVPPALLHGRHLEQSMHLQSRSTASRVDQKKGYMQACEV